MEISQIKKIKFLSFTPPYNPWGLKEKIKNKKTLPQAYNYDKVTSTLAKLLSKAATPKKNKQI